jgi:hypothetical protein
MPKVKKIELSFACDENWNKMKPVDTGRHCSSCSKTVVNFSMLSDEQVIAFYSKKENAKECGNFRVGQLEHINKNLSAPKKVERFSFFKPILASVLLSSAACSDTTKKVAPTHREETKTQPVDERILGQVCTEHQKDTLAKTEQFQTRKITHVKSLSKNKDSIKTQSFPEHEVFDDIRPYPEMDVHRTAGVPMISYDESHTRGLVEPTPAKKKRSFFQRIFKRKNNKTTRELK